MKNNSFIFIVLVASMLLTSCSGVITAHAAPAGYIDDDPPHYTPHASAPSSSEIEPPTTLEDEVRYLHNDEQNGQSQNDDIFVLASSEPEKFKKMIMTWGDQYTGSGLWSIYPYPKRGSGVDNVYFGYDNIFIRHEYFLRLGVTTHNIKTITIGSVSVDLLEVVYLDKDYMDTTPKTIARKAWVPVGFVLLPDFPVSSTMPADYYYLSAWMWGNDGAPGWSYEEEKKHPDISYLRPKVLDRFMTNNYIVWISNFIYNDAFLKTYSPEYDRNTNYITYKYYPPDSTMWEDFFNHYHFENYDKDDYLLLLSGGYVISNYLQGTKLMDTTDRYDDENCYLNHLRCDKDELTLIGYSIAHLDGWENVFQFYPDK